MADTELLPPESERPTPASVWNSPGWKRVRPVVCTLSAAGCLSFVLWGINQFLSLRGVVNVLASRIVLLATVAAAIAGLYIFTRLFSKKGNAYFWVGTLLAIVSGIGLDWWAPRPKEVPLPVPPPVSAVSIYISCDFDNLPLRIPEGSTIHAIMLNPGTLHEEPTIPAYGVIEDITSPPEKSIEWPGERQGRWMTKSEVKEQLKASKGIPNSFAYKCTVSSYGSTIIENLALALIVETGVKKQRAYPVVFDPMVANYSFTFHVVNMCSSGELPIDVQWGTQVQFHVLGEPTRHVAPLHFSKRASMGNWLMLFPGPSAFLWNGMQACHWDK